MRRGLIHGLVCDCAVPVRAGPILGAFLSCRTDGKAATTAALSALSTAGHVVYDSRIDLASSAPNKLRKFHFTFGHRLWEPRMEDGVEVPRDHDHVRFLAVVRDAAVFFSRYRHGTRRSVIWAAGNLSSWASALGALVIASSPVFPEDYSGGDGDNHRPPVHPVVDLD